ncbi:MAG TPA: ABC transporter permease, partial [Gammaproteobacteria bacterium]|nr:ABC transporter permease [Gammaproteobacteria bacterium]
MHLLQSARLRVAGWLDRARQDLHYALRALARSKGFTLSAISVLAVGIGVNVAILHILNAALFHRLSVQDAESLIDFDPTRFSFPMVEFFRKENTVFSRVFAESAGVRVLVGEDAQPKGATFVSADYFSGLGLVPSQGRLLDPADNEAGAAPVAMLGYRYWLRRFGADPGVVGRVIRLNGVAVQVVGVAPADFTGLSPVPGPEQPSLWIPVSVYPELFVGSPVLSSFRQNDAQMYAALRPGVELKAANAQLVALAAELKRRYPDEISMRPEEAGRGKPLLQLP